MPRSAAAWSTPFFTTDQNGSDAWPWVTTSIVMSRPPVAPPLPDGLALSLPHAARTRASTAKPIISLLLRIGSPPVLIWVELRRDRLVVTPPPPASRVGARASTASPRPPHGP